MIGQGFKKIIRLLVCHHGTGIFFRIPPGHLQTPDPFLRFHPHKKDPVTEVPEILIRKRGLHHIILPGVSGQFPDLLPYGRMHQRIRQFPLFLRPVDQRSIPLFVKQPVCGIDFLSERIFQKLLLVSTWTTPFAFDKTPEEEIKKEEFPFSGEGIDDILRYLNRVRKEELA